MATWGTWCVTLYILKCNIFLGFKLNNESIVTSHDLFDLQVHQVALLTSCCRTAALTNQRLSLWELPRHTFADGLNSTLAFVCNGCNRCSVGSIATQVIKWFCFKGGITIPNFLIWGVDSNRSTAFFTSPLSGSTSTEPSAFVDFSVNKELPALLGSKGRYLYDIHNERGVPNSQKTRWS